MRIALAVPSSGGRSGSVQIYARNAASAISDFHGVTPIIYYVPRDGTRLQRNIWKREYDIIQVENRPLYLESLKARCSQWPNGPKFILNLHSLTFVAEKGVGRAVMGKALTAADRIIVNSRAVARHLIRLFPAIGSRVRVVYPGVNTSTFSPSRERNRPCGHYPVVLFAGRLVQRKGLQVAIRAVKILRRTYPQARLLVAGGKHSKSKAGKIVIYIGKVPHSSMPSLYRKATVLICPSQKFEAFGLVNVEAMASGIPVVASRIGGIPEVVRHGTTGYLVDNYRSSKAFADALCRAVDSAKKEALGAAGRQTALERFQWKHTGDTLMKIYHEALEVTG